jgi:hypothetical protein
VPRLEALEERAVPSTLTVTNLSDTGIAGDGSLRGEIAAAQAGDTITFRPGLTGTITLTGGGLLISKSLTINGPGAATLAVSGNNASRVFDFAKGTTDSLSGLTVENGFVNVSSPDGMRGGGIANFGSLTVNGCSIVNNLVRGMDLGDGGGIYNQGTLTISNSTIADNTALGPPTGGGYGGGIMNDVGPVVILRGRQQHLPTIVTISNCTIAGNTADNGGGIAADGTQVTISDSTISGNTANGWAGGIVSWNTLNMHNSIVAGNSVQGGASDLSGSLSSSGHNLIGNTAGGSGFVATDLLNVNPLLGPLQNNGGPTQTMALLPGSPAIDAGDTSQLGVADQRGVVRSGGVNIGAFQASASALVLSAPSSVTAGAPFALGVTAVDPFGQVAVGYRATIHFSSTDTSATLPMDYQFHPSDNGVHTFSGVVLRTKGARTITALDTLWSSLSGTTTLNVL